MAISDPCWPPGRIDRVRLVACCVYGALLPACSEANPTAAPETPVDLVIVVPQAQRAYAPLSSGSTLQLEVQEMDAAGGPIDASLEVTWASSTPDVATVDQTGLLIAMEPGATVVSAKSGELSASVPIFVDTDISLVQYDFEADYSALADSMWMQPSGRPAFLFEAPSGLELEEATFTVRPVPGQLKPGAVIVDQVDADGNQAITGLSDGGLLIRLPKGAYLPSFDVRPAGSFAYYVWYYFHDGSAELVNVPVYQDFRWHSVAMEVGSAPLDSIQIVPGWRIDNFRFFSAG